MWGIIERGAGIRSGLEGIVGEDHVIEDASVRDAFARDHSFVQGIPPRFVVRPASEEEVKGVVCWANATRTPLVPVSSGAPHFYGDTVPGVEGAVVVDLGRMDAIKRIDRRNRLAVIEPGVTYSRLLPALAEEGLAVVTPLRPRANKSVIGSLLERQPTLVPRYHYAFPEPLRSCGVVWGTGDITYTGEAGYGPRSLEAQWAAGFRQVDPKGPAQTDFVRLLSGAQGTLGIVTWASVKCVLLPEARGVSFVGADRLVDLLGVCARLQRLRLGDEVFLANSSFLAALLNSGPGSGPEPDATALRAALPPWVLVVGMAGRALFPAERLAAQQADVADVVRDAAGPHDLRLLSALPGFENGSVLDVLGGVSGEPYWRTDERGDCCDVFFLSTLDRTPALVAEALAVADEAGCPSGDAGVYIQPQQQGVAHHCEITLPFDPGDEAQAACAQAFHARAPERLSALGAYFSRPYGQWADFVYRCDEPSASLLRTVKGVFDPNGVLNPGKLCFGKKESS